MKRLPARVCTAFALCLMAIGLAFVAATPGTAQDNNNQRQAAGEVYAVDAIKVASQHLQVRFIYNEAEFAGKRIDLTDPFPTFESTNHCWRWLEAVLTTFHYGWTRVDPEQKLYRVLKFEELGRSLHAVVDDPAHMEEDLMWGVMIYPLNHADPNSVQRSLLNVITRPGGVAQPLAGRKAVMISDSRTQLQIAAQVLADMDRRPEKVVKAFPVPDGQATDVARHLVNLFTDEIKQGQLAVSTPERTDQRIFVRADADIIEHVATTVRILAANEDDESDSTDDDE